ncbi:vWA domain-containing protein [Petrocella sp. FN5]|uniref:vWA domain-containing protein n=1 Tax=Petrocella sp. FN5 TaxID=3032002 RepID=UPI0023DABFF1|nr:vWA domain-containing protein [Petrocella sp. FN5]MDF1616284.1 VWA domain-containing protein [Petrocella sp. FN5]
MTKINVKSWMSMLLVMVMVVSMGASVQANTVSYEAPIYMNKTIVENKTQVLVDDTFQVSYKFQPQDIPADMLLPEDYNTPKDIILIIDTSGSMAFDIEGNDRYNWYEISYSQYIDKREDYKKTSHWWWGVRYYKGVLIDNTIPSRMELAKNSAKNFLKQLEGLPNTNVGIIEYNTYTSVKDGNNSVLLPIDNTSNYNHLVSAVNSLSANGGTNIGLGMYEGFKALNTNSDSEKYFIFMTDGVPTYYSYYVSNGYSYYYNTETNLSIQLGGTGNSDNDGNALNYGKNIGRLIKNSNLDIQSYFIAFADNDAGNTLRAISDTASGTYKKALTGNALEDIYNELGEQISSDFSLKNVYFQETFDEGFEIVSYPSSMEKVNNTVKGQFGSINYNLNSAGTHFVASPMEFTITLKAKTPGEYVLGEGQKSFIRYRDLDGEEKIRGFAELEMIVTETQVPNMNVNLSNTKEHLSNYILTIDININASLQVYDINDTLLFTLAGAKGENAFDMTRNQLIGTYLKVRATDPYGNVTNETVPIITVLSIGSQVHSELVLQTQINSTISKIDVNEVNIITNGFIDALGQSSHSLPLVEGGNLIEIGVENAFGNTSNLYHEKSIEADNTPPIIKYDHMKGFVLDGSAMPVYVESNGTGSRIVETHYMKLPDGITNADVSDFSGLIGSNQGLMVEMTEAEIDAIDNFAPNINAYEYLHERFDVTENGYYAVYAKDEGGNETVIVIRINNRMDELPNLL